MTLTDPIQIATPSGQVNVELFACPSCGSSFRLHDARVECNSCQAGYAIRDGIPVFREGLAKFSWGVSPEKLAALAPNARRIGWHDALIDLMSELPKEDATLVWNRTLGPHRLALNMLVPWSSGAKVLDFGSGWGTISMNMARSGGNVVSMDQMWEHLEWQRTATRALGVGNITYVQGGDTKLLPFPSDSFDIVVLNGVLEWVASNTTGNPQDVQQHFLKEMARVLKPAGTIFIGIENRWNHKYFRGIPEGHIHMKYGALLPRRLTDLYLRRTRGVPYREYTYTLFGYRKLLSNAGLRNRRFYVPRPHYGRVEHVLPLGEEGDPLLRDWRVETNQTFSKRPESYFAHTYLMTATPRDPSPGLLDMVVHDVATSLELPLPVVLNGSMFSVTTAGKAMVRFGGKDGKQYLIRVGLTAPAGNFVQKQHIAVTGLIRDGLGPVVDNRLPEPLLSGRVAEFNYAVEPLYPGRNAEQLIADESFRSGLLDEAFEFVTALASRGHRLTVDDGIFRKQFSDPINEMKQWFTEREWLDRGPWLAAAESAIKARVFGKKLTLVPRHGDFVPDNCLVDDHGRLSKVLDWEHFEAHGLPMLDWVIFLGRAYRPAVKREMKARGEDPESVRIHGYPDLFMKGTMNEHLARYMAALGLDDSLIEPLLFMWWVKHLQDWLPIELYNPKWRRQRLYPVMDRLKTLTTTLQGVRP